MSISKDDQVPQGAPVVVPLRGSWRHKSLLPPEAVESFARAVVNLEDAVEDAARRRYCGEEYADLPTGLELNAARKALGEAAGNIAKASALFAIQKSREAGNSAAPVASESAP